MGLRLNFCIIDSLKRPNQVSKTTADKCVKTFQLFLIFGRTKLYGGGGKLIKINIATIKLVRYDQPLSITMKSTIKTLAFFLRYQYFSRVVSLREALSCILIGSFLVFTELCATYLIKINVNKRVSLACAARLVDALCLPEAPVVTID